LSSCVVESIALAGRQGLVEKPADLGFVATPQSGHFPLREAVQIDQSQYQQSFWGTGFKRFLQAVAQKADQSALSKGRNRRGHFFDKSRRAVIGWRRRAAPAPGLLSL